MGSRVYHLEDGVRRTALFDVEKQSFTVQTEVNAEPILESIRRDRDDVVPSSTNKLVARVPMTVYERSLHEDWDENDWKRWLNDPENAAFRVWQGKV